MPTPLSLSFDELPGFKMMVALIKATRSIDHEIVRSFCKRKQITEEQFLALEGKEGSIRELVEPVIIEGDDQISRLKRVGMVSVGQEPLQ